jgi:hypothetical protein
MNAEVSRAMPPVRVCKSAAHTQLSSCYAYALCSGQTADVDQPPAASPCVPNTLLGTPLAASAATHHPAWQRIQHQLQLRHGVGEVTACCQPQCPCPNQLLVKHQLLVAPGNAFNTSSSSDTELVGSPPVARYTWAVPKCGSGALGSKRIACSSSSSSSSRAAL